MGLGAKLCPYRFRQTKQTSDRTQHRKDWKFSKFLFYLLGLLIGKTKDITPIDCEGASRAWAWAGAGVGGDESTVETEPGFGLRGVEV